MTGFFAMLLPAFCAASSSAWNFSTNGLRIHAHAVRRRMRYSSGRSLILRYRIGCVMVGSSTSE